MTGVLVVDKSYSDIYNLNNKQIPLYHKHRRGFHPSVPTIVVREIPG